MKTVIVFFVLSFLSCAFASELECKIYEDGRVRLFTNIDISPGKIQQMVFNVGTETWRNPNHARPLCESMRQKFSSFKGLQWSEPECRCFGEKWSTKIAVFESVDGEILKLNPDNWPDYYTSAVDPSFEKLVEKNVPQCWDNCGP
jgi:hypothetical protein